MKIRSRYTRDIVGPGQVKTRERVEEAAEASRSPEVHDRVHISDRGVEIRKARSLALRAPDIRQELVDEVLGQLGRGEYRVSGAQVVPRLIREHLALAGS